MKELKDCRETWRTVPGHPHYQASNMGRVRSIDRQVNHPYGGIALKKGKVLTPHVSKSGYQNVGVTENGNTKTIRLHRLIALAWKSKTAKQDQVNHIDGNKLNNKSSNLEWTTCAGNIRHACKLGLRGRPVMGIEGKKRVSEINSKPIIVIDLLMDKIIRHKSAPDFSRQSGIKTNVILQGKIRSSLISGRYLVINDDLHAAGPLCVRKRGEGMSTMIVSVSGGKTSMFMAKYLRERYPEQEMIFAFANTSKERDETLKFIHDCEIYWDLSVVWLEAVFSDQGNSTRVVDFNTAARDGSVFKAMIDKYGIPNKSFPHCTRELKERTIRRYIRKDLGITDYKIAIGIRYDERHRISESKRSEGFVYPLADEIKATKEFINLWWQKQPFNLNLKDYEGNCDFCWKKSRRKRLTMLSEGLNVSDWERWELESGYVFDRDGYSISELKKMSESNFHKVKDVEQVKSLSPGLFNMDSELDCFCKTT